MTKFNKALSLILLVFITISCGKDKETNFTLNGKIKGLKKGVVYLQKDGDSSVVDLDSISDLVYQTNGHVNFNTTGTTRYSQHSSGPRLIL